MVKIMTERLTIRDYQEADFDGFHEILTSDEVMKLMPEVQSGSVDESLKFLYESIAESKFENRRKFFFAITVKETGRYIGEIGFSTLIEAYEGRVVNLGYFIMPEYWGQGLVTEAVEGVMNYAFNELGVIKIESGCLKANVGSTKVMTKVGMTLEADLLKHMYYNEELHDRLSYRMLKEEWKALHL